MACNNSDASGVGDVDILISLNPNHASEAVEALIILAVVSSLSGK